MRLCGSSRTSELATGWPTVGRDSDLDLVVHARNPLSRAEARRRLDALPALGARIDVQMETPAGVVALSEFAGQGDGAILLRGRHGPHLVRDPWDWIAADRPQ
ncbi:phosphoribosyl-dephospho-CoA transferase [mine drainage metagenome]|uniref:Phosphoribosyl-dephospho-CoA transferase n=1 Tax=mine drainage metagenome TaxID=410659 RepID=A0A1J5PA17_9ZZZZ